MKFPYLRHGSYDMPIVPVALRHGNCRMFTEALVDSGSSCSIFHAGLAMALGIHRYHDGTELTLVGVSGHSIKGYRHVIDMEFEGNIFPNVEVVFTEEVPLDSIDILGQSGFFELFPIRFLQSRGEIDVQMRSKYTRL